MSSFSKNTSLLHVVAAAIMAFLIVWTFWPSSPKPRETGSVSQLVSKPRLKPVDDTWCPNLRQKTFYDDPNLSYSIGRPIKNWDDKRRDWMRLHPSGRGDRVVMVTGSQPSPCRNPIGDHLLLRLFKNKVDYCRINGYDIFYNNALLHRKMDNYWAKIPAVRSAMVAHPEAEWIWWVDSDAVFTDMDFRPPLEDRYKDYNLVVGGSPDSVYDNPSWIGLNAGVFYIRNCQWSMEFLEAWAEMGPQTPNYEKWGQILASRVKDKLYPISDDQTAMIYLLMKEKEKWSDKVFLEHEYCIQGYWAGLVGTLENVTRNYVGLERRARRLRRRRAEKVGRSYSALWEKYLEAAGYRKDAGKRPCVTHFTGCQPCSGDHNPMYTGDSCREGMERALNFADNQVLRSYGFVHPDLLDSASAVPLPFDFAA
ncbi:putative glycosyltransferase 7 [Diospyros lotus]|uniref:putative glycosyltransferase 7 n=1 Tax=Diospyros lotus TaxID=55363 RepID=UPI0022530485|nr:putative glycosyltransferase 7 [Diospyros lotus]